jgi:hypothetical protein
VKNRDGFSFNIDRFFFAFFAAPAYPGRGRLCGEKGFPSPPDQDQHPRGDGDDRHHDGN